MNILTSVLPSSYNSRIGTLYTLVSWYGGTIQWNILLVPLGYVPGGTRNSFFLDSHFPKKNVVRFWGSHKGGKCNNIYSCLAVYIWCLTSTITGVRDPVINYASYAVHVRYVINA